jgi:hypothetical protein
MTTVLYKATVEIGDKKITFEGPREFVEGQVARLTVEASKHEPHLLVGSNEGTSLPAQVTERELLSAKRPRGHPEVVAVLAFAFAQAGTVDFTEEDMRRAYLRAGVRPPKVVGQAIRDAKNRLDYIERGRGRGTYRLSPHGDRTVRFDLPRQ